MTTETLAHHWCVGIDLHKDTMTVCVLIRGSGEFAFRKIPCKNRDQIVEFFRALPRPHTVAIEAVGVPGTFEQCTALVRPGGTVANVGVHGKPATLHLEELWIKDVTITTGLVDTYSTPTLLRLLASRQLDLGQLVTHHFGLDDFMEAYEVFANAADTQALKVVLSARS